MQNTIRFAEVQFYFRINVNDAEKQVALVSLFSQPEVALRTASHETLLVCSYCGDDTLVVVEAQAILSVIAMVPFPSVGPDSSKFFVVEKIGLDVVEQEDGEEPPENE